MGTVGLALTPPPIFTDQLMFASASVAVSVRTIPEGRALTGGHVALHLPLRFDFRRSGESPLEKATDTTPAVSGVPQSSSMAASSGVGHAAGTVKLSPSSVKTGRSFVGVQLPLASGRSPRVEADGVAPVARISRRLAERDVPPAKLKVRLAE